MRTAYASILAATVAVGMVVWGGWKVGVAAADGEESQEASVDQANEDAEPAEPATPVIEDDVASDADEGASGEVNDEVATAVAVQPGRIPEFVVKGVDWLIAAQHNDGGWGAGSHAHQDVRDPHAVVTDPATTAFTLLALLRGGHSPIEGDYQAQVRRGLEYLLSAVEKAPSEGPLITSVEATQPQTKLGRYIDTAMTAQYLARALALLPEEDELRTRVDKALDVCLAKLQQSQHEDGSWGQGGGWAPVLQSSLSCSALELAQASGKPVDENSLARARAYQKGNYDRSSGRARADAAAGVELYAFNGAFRGNAVDARHADDLIASAVADGRLEADADATVDNMLVAGAGGGQDAAGSRDEAEKLAAAVAQNRGQIERLGDEALLAGFGNNGGEEFLSYLMTSETLLIAGGDKFHEWQDKMQGRLAKIQNSDGSWSGHHCITSPVFCTAAVVQCIAADQDAEFLIAMAERTRGDAEIDGEAEQAVAAAE